MKCLEWMWKRIYLLHLRVVYVKGSVENNEQESLEKNPPLLQSNSCNGDHAGISDVLLFLQDCLLH